MNNKNISFLILIISLIIFSSKSSANEEGEHKHIEKERYEHNEHEDSDEGEHDDEERELPAGITFFNDENGEFSLSAEAIKNFEILFEPFLVKDLTASVPNQAIVRSLENTFLYLKTGEKFVQIKIKVVTSGNASTVIKVEKSLSNALLVTRGVNFLKTIQLSLEEDPSEGHGH